MHLKRWITGIVAVPFLIFFIYKGGLTFALFIAVISAIGLMEYFRIIFHPSDYSSFNIISIIGVLTGPLIIWTAHKFTMDLVVCIVIFNLMLSAFISITKFKSDENFLELVAKEAKAILYIPVMLSFAVLIRDGSDGMLWFFMVLAVVFAGDTGAFYAGSYLGKHKLCPSVSPGKTIEGAIGGLLSNVLVGSLILIIFLPRLDFLPSILFFTCLGIAGQIGDLFESEFKRVAGIKDSGNILPGHGGILDRIDALLFALPVAYFFKKFILWI